MHIEHSPFTTVMRLYDDVDGYAKRLPYKAILMAQWQSAAEVYLCCTHGEIDWQVWKLAMDILSKAGVKKVTFERRGKTKTYEI